MKFLLALLLAVAIQAGLVAMHHYGELDTFWYVVLEVVAVPLCFAIIVISWVRQIEDWSK